MLVFCSFDFFGNAERYLIAGTVEEYPTGWIKIMVSVSGTSFHASGPDWLVENAGYY